MEKAGFDRGIASMDATHATIENCRFGLRQVHLGHRLNKTAWACTGAGDLLRRPIVVEPCTCKDGRFGDNVHDCTKPKATFTSEKKMLRSSLGDLCSLIDMT
jgi:hypothetical protein